MKNTQDIASTINHDVTDAISRCGLPIRKIEKGTMLYRVQESRYPQPTHYNAHADTRYADHQRRIGVCYVAASDIVAVAETLQHGQAGQYAPVLHVEIEARSLHRLETTRELVIVDAAQLARITGRRLGAIVESRGTGSEGYVYTQILSAVVMRQGLLIDGLLYPSQTYPITGRWEGCNLALFGERPTQLTGVDKQALDTLELTTGESVGEFLNRLRIPVE